MGVATGSRLTGDNPISLDASSLSQPLLEFNPGTIYSFALRHFARAVAPHRRRSQSSEFRCPMDEEILHRMVTGDMGISRENIAVPDSSRSSKVGELVYLNM